MTILNEDSDRIFQEAELAQIIIFFKPIGDEKVDQINEWGALNPFELSSLRILAAAPQTLR